MDNLIKNGDEVLVFNYLSKSKNSENMKHYIKGKVLSSNLSHDLSVHGSAHYERIYTVLGDDGKYYIGTYGMAWVGNYFILSIEGYISYLKCAISSNNKTIETIQRENDSYKEILNNLKIGKEKVLKK